MPVSESAPDPAAVRQACRYEALTWPEINLAVAQQKAVVLPVGSIEQHGHHLPLDVDVRLATAVCLEAGKRAPEQMLVLPPFSFGYCHHVMDFPGTINIEPTTFVNVLLDITKSLAHHGFRRIIIVNGHGSNQPLIELAGRQTILQTEALCCTLSWWQLIADYWNNEVRTSTIPGGCAHACELETSVYLHLNEAGVRKDRIRGAIPTYMTDIPGAEDWHWVDLTAGSGPATIVEWTSSYTETGSLGEPEKATVEKGELAFERAVRRLVDLVTWFRIRPAPPRRPRQTVTSSSAPPFGF